MFFHADIFRDTASVGPMPCDWRPFSRPTSRHAGFTLVEFIVVIVLAGIIFSFGSVLIGNVFSSSVVKRDISDADWQAKVALERMTRELRMVRSATAVDLAFPSANEIRFVDTDGNNVCFYLNAGQLARAENPPAQACGTVNRQVLADNITSLGFSYWDNSGAEISPPAPPASVSAVYYITVSLTVTEGVYNNSFRTNVRPRNF